MEAEFGGLFVVVAQYVMVASIVGLARENVMGVWQTKDKEDDIMLIIGIAICFLFDFGLLETTVGHLSAFRVGSYVDYIVSGSAMAGGGAKLITRIKRDQSSLRKATAE